MGRPISKVSTVAVAGPLAPFAARFKARLEELGYTPLTTVNILRLLSHLSRWLDAGALAAADLSSVRVERYFHERRAAGYRGSRSPRSLAVLLELLRTEGVLVAEEPAPACSTVETLLAAYESYLLTEGALAASTAQAYVLRARRFLTRRPEVSLAGLTAGDVSAAVLAEAGAGSVGSTQFFVVALRAFLRFCFVQGLTPSDLSAAALSVTGRRRPGLPQGISRADAMALLGSCDRRTAVGRRDYAVPLRLLRLGLPLARGRHAAPGRPGLAGGRARGARQRPARGPATPAA